MFENVFSAKDLVQFESLYLFRFVLFLSFFFVRVLKCVEDMLCPWHSMLDYFP